MSAVNTDTHERPGERAGAGPAARPRPKRRYIPAVGPKLKVLLFVVFGLVALLGANSAYMATITFLDWLASEEGVATTYKNAFYLWMVLLHIVLGLVFIVPFVLFGIIHMKNAWRRKNRRAVRIGYALFVTSLVVLGTGLALFPTFVELKSSLGRSIVYWLHVACPLVAVWLYWLHRLAGPPIKWRIGISYLVAVGVLVVGMGALHHEDPREWYAVGSKEGVKYFEPSLARTKNGKFIPEKALMRDQFCLQCHADAHAGWKDSVHRFSSFNNPAYFASIVETREVALKRDGNVKASRWCAGCHDPVPFFSGQFDDPEYDIVGDPTAHAGITCTVCHAITNINSTKGNADFTIEEPMHYPFAYSENPILKWVHNQLVKAKPEFHKKTFLKPFHKSAGGFDTSAEFCSACHKVHLPRELNHYRDFLRGQNHYDPWLLSGVSGHGARSFYYPPASKTCSDCHMPLQESNDFGAKLFDDSGVLKIHSHLFPTANTGVAWLREKPEVVEAHRNFLEGVMRVDIFGVKEGINIQGELHAPLRPEVPELVPGREYLLETVIRTVKMGHLFTQGTADSNEVWMDVTVTSGGEVIGRSGGMDEKGQVDPWSHFVNVFMLDREGNRINRRNPQDIFTPLYNHQIPPGAGQVVHYGLKLPADLAGPVTVKVRLQYRKFDWEYMDYVARQNRRFGKLIRGDDGEGAYENRLPVVTLAEDKVTFPVKGSVPDAESIRDTESQPPPDIPEWERWNDYGIGLLLEGTSELRQAAEAFRKVEELGVYHGPLNLARVLFREAGPGQLDEAVDAINRAAKYTDPPAPRWTLNWLRGLINQQQGHLEEAAENFRSVLEDVTAEMRRRKFDFSLDYEVRNSYGEVLFDIARAYRRRGLADEAAEHFRRAIEQFRRTLEVDSENVTAHHNLHLLYQEIGDEEKAAEHQRLHARYKPDDTARGRAVRLARIQYPAADHAAEELVIYDLHREQAYQLDPASLTGAPAGERRKDK